MVPQPSPMRPNEAPVMPIHREPLDALFAALLGGVAMDRWSGPGGGDVVVVDLDTVPDGGSVPALHSGIPTVVVGLTDLQEPERHPAGAACDLVLGHGEEEALDAVVATVEAHPVAATAFVLLLRGSAQRSIDDGLLAESAVYSALQAGPEFASWRAARPRRPHRRTFEPVALTRARGVLHVTLDRPEVRNALDTDMRDRLVEAFDLVALDPSIEAVHLWGAGEAFCAGGDLDEFGSFPDPATAHLVRLGQSVGRRIAAAAPRVTAHLHGACVGSGIELPAFAGRVVADRSARLALPEVSLGLVPGAGGSVSLPRRIGRHRTARLGLGGVPIDAEVALAWGLIDEITDAPQSPPSSGR